MKSEGQEWPEITQDTYLIIPRWDEYQHYKQRDPPWIKVHTKLLSNAGFLGLSPAARGVLLTLWLAYSRTQGQLKVSTWSALGGAKGVGYPQLVSLNHAGFLAFSASNLLAAHARSREEEEEEEEDLPKKVSKRKGNYRRAATMIENGGWQYTPEILNEELNRYDLTETDRTILTDLYTKLNLRGMPE